MARELVNTEACVKVWRGTGWIKTRVLGYGGYAGVVRPPLRVMSMNYTHKSVPMCVTCPAGRIAKRPVMSIRPIRLRPVNGNPKVLPVRISEMHRSRTHISPPPDLHYPK